MTEPNRQYRALTCMAWGLFFQYFNLNLGRVNVLPPWVGWLLLLRGITLLEEDQRDLTLLRPFGWICGLWTLAHWAGVCLGFTFSAESWNLVLALSLVVGVLDLYFHFQLFTDLADLAGQVQPEGTVRARLLRWRTVQTVLITVANLLSFLPLGDRDWWETLNTVAAVITLAAVIASMAATFALRKLFLPESGIEEHREL